jgi:hypothetical protein
MAMADGPTLDLTIRILTLPMFLPTKLEAHAGWGNGDFIMSRDAEDILLIVNGREELLVAASSYRTTRLSPRSFTTSSGYTFPRRPMPSSCPSMKRARSRHSTGRSRVFR